ncbi:uncharacterized protein LOC144924475 [Branchiostoma floridae x Branchiostoma belcheri]
MAAASSMSNFAGRHDHCCVPHCTNDARYDTDKRLSFHSFPSDPVVRRQWIHAIRRDVGHNFKITISTKVCSAHFNAASLKRTLVGKRVLRKGSVPSIFSWTDKCKSARKPPKMRSSSVLEEAESDEVQKSDSNMEVCDTGTAVDHDYAQGPSKPSLEEQLAVAMEHIKKLELQNNQLKCLTFNAQRFSSDPDTLRFYTGFQSYSLFFSMYKALEPTATRMITWAQMQRGRDVTADMRDIMKHGSLSCIDQFFLFLCYCKCGLFEKDLSVRFNVSLSTVSRIIITWANYLYHILGALPIWPSRAQVDEHMPDCFRTMYPKTRVVLDCTELRCQTPSSLYCNSQMYSNYKSHTTFKGLIGITPSGAVSFVSQLYSGSISDVDITSQSGIVELLDENDDVMADNGFTISKLVSKKVLL